MTIQTMSKDDINKATGKRLQDIRKRRRLTQKQLANLVGIHHVTLHGYEAGEHSIPVDKLLLIAYHLRVRVSDLVVYPEVR